MTPEQRRLVEQAMTLSALASGLTDAVKKHVFHGHRLRRDDVLTMLSELIATATDALQFVWLTEEDDDANR